MKQLLAAAIATAVLVALAAMATAGDPLFEGLTYQMEDRNGNPAGTIAVWDDAETIFVTPAGGGTPKVYEWVDPPGKYVGVDGDSYEFTQWPTKTWIYTSATSSSSLAGTMTQDPAELQPDPVN